MADEAETASSAVTNDTPISAAATVTADASPAPNTDAVAADTSAADPDAKKPASLLDVVKNVLEPKPADGSSTATAQTETKPADGVKPATDEAAADANLPFHKHPRWIEKQTELKAAREKLATLEPENASLKADAEQLRNIETFRTTNNLAVEEVVQGFKVMALVKNDPAKALPELRKLVADLELATGEKLPADLQERVDAGSMDEKSASELAQTRRTAKALETTVTATRERDETQQVQNLRDGVAASVAAWEAQVAGRDPDWAKKQPLVMDRVQAIALTEGRPRDQAEAVALAKRAYEDVTKSTAAWRPARTPTKPLPSGTSANGVKPQPKNMRDVVDIALGAAA